jgi:carboxylesterase
MKTINKLMPGSEPIFIKGNRTGVLFIHGFTASPFEGKELAHWMHDQMGFTVSVPLLPGHGTHPSDLKSCQWMDWYYFVKYKYFELKDQCKFVFVCGQSVGGTLGLHLASHHQVDGIITLAGAVFLKDWRLFLLPLARHIVPYHYKSKGPDIRNKSIKRSVPTYTRYPVRSIDQLLQLFRHIREDLSEVSSPALLIHSRKDRTVHFGNLQYIYDHISSQIKEMYILEESYHVISIDVEREKVFEKTCNFILRIQNNQEMKK